MKSMEEALLPFLFYKEFISRFSLEAEFEDVSILIDVALWGIPNTHLLQWFSRL